MYSPLLFVVVSRDNPTSLLRRVTFALGTNAPEGSCTLPKTDPWSTWPNTAGVCKRRKSKQVTVMQPKCLNQLVTLRSRAIRITSKFSFYGYLRFAKTSCVDLGSGVKIWGPG